MRDRAQSMVRGELDLPFVLIAECRRLGGLLLGETFAIQFLREMKMCSREPFDGFSLTKFDGTQITI